MDGTSLEAVCQTAGESGSIRKPFHRLSMSCSIAPRSAPPEPIPGRLRRFAKMAGLFRRSDVSRCRTFVCLAVVSSAQNGHLLLRCAPVPPSPEGLANYELNWTGLFGPHDGERVKMCRARLASVMK